jgi:hypothetical protein
MDKCHEQTEPWELLHLLIKYERNWKAQASLMQMRKGDNNKKQQLSMTTQSVQNIEDWSAPYVFISM